MNMGWKKYTILHVVCDKGNVLQARTGAQWVRNKPREKFWENINSTPENLTASALVGKKAKNYTTPHTHTHTLTHTQAHISTNSSLTSENCPFRCFQR